MASFVYKATDPAGKVTKGVLEASEERGAVSQLHAMGLIPIRVTASRKGRGGLDVGVSRLSQALLGRITSKDLVVFTQDLSSLLEAGLPVDRALGIITGVTEKERLKEVVSEVLKAVQGGSYLSDALAKYPKVFSSFYVNMVRAGEAGGVLEGVLARLGVFQETAEDLKDFIKSAMVYPVFLVFVGGASIIILLTFVIPKFSVIFSEMGGAIPLSTRLLLGFSEIVRLYWWAALGAGGLAWWLFRRYTGSAEGRLRVDKRKLKLPVFGELIQKIEVARFARTLGTLMNSGVPILQALTLVKAIIGNRVIARALDRIHERVKEGDRLSKPLEEAGIFPSLAIQMITVGEETGRLDEMLLKVAESYEKVVKNMVKRMISFLEPAMILVMGLVVGFIVVSMLLAIFSVNELPF